MAEIESENIDRIHAAETESASMEKQMESIDAVSPDSEKDQEHAGYTGIPVTYYPIREDLARRAKEMNSFFEYQPGRATQEYRHCVDQAVRLAEQQKERADPIYHEKIDRLVDMYARKLAENMNKGYEIDARVP